MPTKNIKGYAFEWFVRWVLNHCGFASVRPDNKIIYEKGRDVMIHGLGQPHNADVLVAPPVQIPLYFPSRLLIECKCKKESLGIEHGRNVLGLREDINSFYIVTPEILDKRRNYTRRGSALYSFDRYHYQVALASTSGFKRSTQEFAAVHKIPLIQFSSSIFTHIIQLIWKLDEITFSEYEATALKDIFASREDISIRTLDLSPDVKDWAYAMVEESRKIATYMRIGILDNGSILFLARPVTEDSRDNLHYSDGYTLYWSQESKYWILRERGTARYYFELPVELLDIWANRYTENMYESAINLKAEYLKSISVYTKNQYGKPIIEVLTLSPSFINDAVREYRAVEEQP